MFEPRKNLETNTIPKVTFSFWDSISYWTCNVISIIYSFVLYHVISLNQLTYLFHLT
ncbi:Ovule protein [Bacillus mobilis]